MPAPTSTTKFWIICREETPLTQQLVKEINGWQLSGVRARMGYRMALSVEDAIARSNHAIFISLCDYPCGQIQIEPVIRDRSTALQSPASFLTTLRQRYGSAPNAWWFQLPTTEACQRGIKHIPSEHTLSQTLNKVEMFVRNHYTRYQVAQAVASGAIASQHSQANHTQKVLQAA
ncbi:MAG: hypothetical protein AAFN12_03685 [Cyanobacteria bacterium J06560_2]